MNHTNIMIDEQRIIAALSEGQGVRYLVGLPLAQLLKIIDESYQKKCITGLIIPYICSANTPEEYTYKTAFLDCVKEHFCGCMFCRDAGRIIRIDLQKYPRRPPSSRHRINNIYDRKINIQIERGALIYYLNASREVISRSYCPKKKEEYEKRNIDLPSLILQNRNFAPTIL